MEPTPIQEDAMAILKVLRQARELNQKFEETYGCHFVGFRQPDNGEHFSDIRKLCDEYEISINAGEYPVELTSTLPDGKQVFSLHNIV